MGLLFYRYEELNVPVGRHCVYSIFSSGKLQSIWNMQTHSVFRNGIPVTCIPFSLTWQFFEKINLSSCWMSFSLATKGLHKIFWTFLLSLPTDIYTHSRNVICQFLFVKFFFLSSVSIPKFSMQMIFNMQNSIAQQQNGTNSWWFFIFPSAHSVGLHIFRLDIA